eukprot:scaffold423_cov69-Phaeocystis_antarctica.AAC.5
MNTSSGPLDSCGPAPAGRPAAAAESDAAADKARQHRRDMRASPGRAGCERPLVNDEDRGALSQTLHRHRGEEEGEVGNHSIMK